MTQTTSAPRRLAHDSEEYKAALASSLRWDADRKEPYLQLPNFPHIRLAPFREGIEDDMVTLFNHPEVGKRLYSLPYPMPRSFAESWVEKDLPKHKAIISAIAEHAVSLEADEPISPKPNAPLLNGSPFKSVWDTEQGRIIADIKYAIDTENADGSNKTEDEAYAVPRAQQKYELGYVLEPAAWGKGLATEIVGAIVYGYGDVWVRPGTLSAYAETDNAGSGRVLVKNGLQKIKEISEKWPEHKGGEVHHAGYYERRV
ncbi:hypothetical protein Q8F55_008940 [Vanrija albida]|uniref:N-acetyltransferase domain-containing protein n=1 Tax=Vanrija albida TaxID=181172 RepID=A0ABR3PS83_9TREE